MFCASSVGVVQCKNLCQEAIWLGGRLCRGGAQEVFFPAPCFRPCCFVFVCVCCFLPFVSFVSSATQVICSNNSGCCFSPQQREKLHRSFVTNLGMRQMCVQPCKSLPARRALPRPKSVLHCGVLVSKASRGITLRLILLPSNLLPLMLWPFKLMPLPCVRSPKGVLGVRHSPLF